jgi:hypothetical protein
VKADLVLPEVGLCLGVIPFEVVVVHKNLSFIIIMVTSSPSMALED